MRKVLARLTLVVLAVVMLAVASPAPKFDGPFPPPECPPSNPNCNGFR